MTQHLVTYTGTGTRIITKDDWDSIGIVSPTLTWTSLTSGHNPTVTVDDISEEMLNYFRNIDTTGFKVKEATADPTTSPADNSANTSVPGAGRKR